MNKPQQFSAADAIASSLALLANAGGFVPSNVQRPQFLSAAVAFSAGTAGSTGTATFTCPSDFDFVAWVGRAQLRIDSTWRLVTVTSATGGGTAGSASTDGQENALADFPFLCQVRDNGSQGRGISDTTIDGNLLFTTDGNSCRRWPRPLLLRATSVLTVELTLKKAIGAACTAYLSLEGYADFSKPSAGWK